MDVFDGLAFADEAKQVNCEHFFVGKFRGGVVALPLLGGVEPSGSASADEQINADERVFPVGIFWFGGHDVGVIHVVKGDLREDLDSPLQIACGGMVFNP